MTLVDAVFTRTDFNRLPEGFPAQLIEGCLVRQPSPSFGHQNAAARIYGRLVDHVGDQRVAIAPLDIAIDNLNVYQPDVVAFADPLPLDIATKDLPIPVLAVEVLAPSTQHNDREIKTRRLLAAGVREVWLVDEDGPSIDIYTVDGLRTCEDREAATSRALPGLRIIPAELVLDETA